MESYHIQQNTQYQTIHNHKIKGMNLPIIASGEPSWSWWSWSCLPSLPLEVINGQSLIFWPLFPHRKHVFEPAGESSLCLLPHSRHLDTIWSLESLPWERLPLLHLECNKSPFSFLALFESLVFSKLVKDMVVSHLMVQVQQIEKEKFKEKTWDSKRQRGDDGVVLTFKVQWR